MSASSSTIRISDAISQCSLSKLGDDLVFDFGLFRSWRAIRGGARAGRNVLVDEVQPRPGATLAGKLLRGVMQADAVVDHVDEDVVALTRRDHANAAPAALGLWDSGDGLGCVLDDVGKPLR